MFETICKMNTNCQPKVLEQTIQLTFEIAREGREGRKTGTIFVLGDEEAVLKESRPLILDPLKGHPPEVNKIFDLNQRGCGSSLQELGGTCIYQGVKLLQKSFLKCGCSVGKAFKSRSHT